MNYKFINRQGKEISIDSLRSFINLVKSEQIEKNTLIYNNFDSTWRKASEYDEFQAILLNWEKSKKKNISVFPVSENKIKKKNRSQNLVIASIIVILVAIVLLSIAGSKYYANATEGIAYKFGMMLGYSFWIAVFSYLIWKFIFKKRKGVGLLCFSIIFLLISGFQAINMLKQLSQSKIVVKDVSSSIKDLTSDIFTEKSQKTTTQNHSPKSYGKFDPVMVWFQNHLSVVKQDYFDFNSAMEREHIETLLTPETLSNHSKIVEAKDKLRKINQLIDNYEKLLEKRSIDAINKMNSLGIDGNIKKEAIEGFYEGKKEGDKYFREYFRIERAFLAEVDNLLNFLLSRSGNYWFDNDQIVFISDSDITWYNKIIQKINQLAEEESEWTDQYQKAIILKTQQFEKSLQ